VLGKRFVMSGCQVKALLLCPNKTLFRYRVYVFLEDDEILNVIQI